MRFSGAEFVFWISLSAVVYSYAVYPLLLFVLASLWQTARDIFFLLGRQNRRREHQEEFVPRVALLVAAYNEAGVMEAKLRNTAHLDFPSEQVEFLLGLDAPTDATAACAARIPHPRFRVFSFEARRGKLAVINDLVERTTADLLVFSDANTMLEPDCLRKLVRHFANPEVGAVCGELRLASPEGKPQMESLYWRYEVALKFLENRLNCVLGANGAVYAVRRSLFRPADHWIVEDFQVPMDIRFAGNRVVYDPEALATEEAAPTFRAEFARKVRIGAGDFQTLIGNLRFLNPFRGMPALAYFSHKVLRWLGPVFLLAAWISSMLLAPQPLYVAALAVQTGFYALALAGYWQERRGHVAGLLAAPFYFAGMNLALLLGMLHLVSGKQKTVWSTTPRNVPSSVAPVKRNSHE